MSSHQLTFGLIQTGALAGLNFGVDSGLWKLMAKNGDKPQKVDDLASTLGVDRVLLGEYFRVHLNYMHVKMHTNHMNDTLCRS
jgi:hypothetical protein